MSIEKIINDAWDIKDQINQNSEQKIKDSINQVINDLDSGKSRVAEKINGEWVTHQYLKKAILLSFKISDEEISLISFLSLSKTPSTFVINSNLLDFNDFAIAPAAVSPLILYG